MNYIEKLKQVSKQLEETQNPEFIWSEVPVLIDLLAVEFQKRLNIKPLVLKVELILVDLQPQLTYGVNSLIFILSFPEVAGLTIYCESKLEYPCAMISVKKQPYEETELAKNIIEKINKSYVGHTFEASLFDIDETS